MPEPRKPLRELFIEALAIEDAQERAAFLERASGGNALLRKQIEDLIHADAQAGGFLGSSVAETFPHEAHSDALSSSHDPEPALPALSKSNGSLSKGIQEMTDSPSEQPAFKLLQRIGEGGMGAVYMAEQEKPVRRRVALEVIKLGMDTRQVIARFEAEGQALTLMDHPARCPTSAMQSS